MNYSSTLLVFCLFILFSGQNLWAQKYKSKLELSDYPVEKRLTIADEAFNSANYYGCMDYYESILNEDPGNYYVAHQLAKANEYVLDYKQAEYYFEIVVDAGTSEYPLARYDYATMLKRNGKYDKAEEQFVTFSKRYRGDDSRYFKSAAKREIDGCKYASKMLENPKDIIIENLGDIINTAYYELAPVLIDDNTLLFSSLPSDTIIHVKTKKEAKTYVTKIYTATKEDDTWQDPEALPDRINNNLYHAANGTFSVDKTKFYFSRCTDIEDEMMCAIYVCNYDNGKFGEATILGEEINRIDHSSTQPRIGYDHKGNEVLYFASNRGGGKGGYDIWYAEIKKNNTFKSPVNVGKNINTEEDDITPFYDLKTKTLYFSSEGHVGFGGFDIYRSKAEGKKWRTPQNMGHPLNSSVDDLYFILDWDRSDGFDDGYFVSNRAGSITLKSETCCNDIYRFEWVRPPVFAVQGYVFQKGDTTETPINEALVKLIDKYGSEGDSSFQSQHTRNDSMYFFTLAPESEYTLTGSKEGYFSGKGATSTRGLKKSDTLRVDLYLDKIVKDKAYTLKNIYYDYDKATLRPESKAALEELLDLLNEHNHLIVEIGSHTDSRGTEAYNERLSQNRAKSVVQYLIQSGIPTKRLVAKGYGESQPKAPNEHPDGSDNPEGRQKNRRTEFKIIGELDGSIKIIN